MIFPENNCLKEIALKIHKVITVKKRKPTGRDILAKTCYRNIFWHFYFYRKT
jgi:hypothetical protein